MKPLSDLPFDPADLTYGSRIETHTIEEICQVPATDRRFDLECLLLMEVLTETLQQVQKVEYDLVREKDTIVILTPEQMTSKIGSRRRASIRKLNKAVRKGHAIPTAQLPEELQKKAAHELHRVGNLLDFATRRRPPPPPQEGPTHKRPFK